MDDGTQAGGCVKAACVRSRRAEAACDLGVYAANITLQHVPADAAWRAAGDDVRRLRDDGVPEDARTVYIVPRPTSSPGGASNGSGYDAGR